MICDDILCRSVRILLGGAAWWQRLGLRGAVGVRLGRRGGGRERTREVQERGRDRESTRLFFLNSR